VGPKIENMNRSDQFEFLGVMAGYIKIHYKQTNKQTNKQTGRELD
jgi:hypothetical protein